MIRIPDLRQHFETELPMTGTVFYANPGEVYHLWCGQCCEAKYKFFVVAYAEPKLRYFLINSHPAKFQRERQELLAHQIVLAAQDHSFLKHDSVLDCSEVLGGDSLEELSAKYDANHKVYIGQIAPGPRAKLKTIVAGSKVLSQREKDAILSVW